MKRYALGLHFGALLPSRCVRLGAEKKHGSNPSPIETALLSIGQCPLYGERAPTLRQSCRTMSQLRLLSYVHVAVRDSPRRRISGRSAHASFHFSIIIINFGLGTKHRPDDPISAQARHCADLV